MQRSDSFMYQDGKGVATFDFATSGDFKGICAACLKTPDKNEIWPKKKSGDMYAKQLNTVELVTIAHALINASEEYSLMGWGTLGYDLRLLFTEGIMKEEVINLALLHYDVMFQIFADYGQMVALHSLQSVKPYIDKTVPQQTPKLWVQDIRGQNMVIAHMEASTERVFDVAINFILSQAITWIDKNTSSLVSYRNKLSPCMKYILPATMLPKSILNQKWSTTFDWIREYASPNTPSENQEEKGIYQMFPGLDKAISTLSAQATAQAYQQTGIAAPF
jgi:hypothetical protein